MRCRGASRASTISSTGFQPVVSFMVHRQDACATFLKPARRSGSTLKPDENRWSAFSIVFAIRGRAIVEDAFEILMGKQLIVGAGLSRDSKTMIAA